MANSNKNVKTKMSITKMTGYHCDVCNVETVVYGNDPAPDVCLSCKTPAPRKAWQDIITNTTMVETLPLT